LITSQTKNAGLIVWNIKSLYAISAIVYLLARRGSNYFLNARRAVSVSWKVKVVNNYRLVLS
jgi:hypothetical protein